MENIIDKIINYAKIELNENEKKEFKEMIEKNSSKSLEILNSVPNANTENVLYSLNNEKIYLREDKSENKEYKDKMLELAKYKNGFVVVPDKK